MQAVIKATKVAIMAIGEADTLTNNVRPVHAAPRFVGPALKLPTLDWKLANKYWEMCNLEIEVKKFSLLTATIHRSWRGSNNIELVRLRGTQVCEDSI